MNDPAGWDERRKALEGQIDEMKRQQRDEQLERRIAIKGQIDEMKRLHEEQDARQKALMEQIEEMKRLEQAERIENKKGLRLGFVLKLGKPCGKDGRTKDPWFLQDRGDAEAHKGFLKLHILGVLAEGPSHGYEIMHRISHHTGHMWRPSPGSMYPSLEALGSKGFISCQGDGRRKVYSLTSKGEDVLDRIRKKHDEQFSEMKAFMSALFDE